MSARYFKLDQLALLLGAGVVAGCSNDSSSNGPAPTVSLTNSTATINYGQSLELSWTSTNAGMCTASTVTGGGNFAGNETISGSASVAPTAPGTVSYTLTCSGPGGTTSVTSPTITVNPNILSTLSVANITQIGNTFTTTAGGLNPYGLAIAPATTGPLISAGDLIACNFNDLATNTQGNGTTIVGLHPTASANAGGNPYLIANDPSLLGCNALTLLPDDTISASAYNANLNPFVSPTGVVSNPFPSGSFGLPWGETYAPANGSQPAALYVSNVGSGSNASIVRIPLGGANGDTPGTITEIATGFCGGGSPGAIYAPSGLTYDPSVDTLYIVDTASYSVVAFANVSSIGLDGVLVNGSCTAAVAGGYAPGTVTPTPALQFSGPSAVSATVLASPASVPAFDAPISAALLSDGDLIVGNGDIDAGADPTQYNQVFEVSPALGVIAGPVQLDSTGTPGALFGIAATVDSSGNQLVYFNDDNTSTVNLLSK